jgi:type VI secretion system protein ImpK
MERASSRVSLAELATEVCLFALGMRDRAQSAQFSSVHNGTMRLLDEFEAKAKAEKIDPADIADVKYALAALVDEVVLSADWSGRDSWSDDPLQLHYFGTYLAGEGFFERLDGIKAQGKSRADALRVYYECLLLGFKGKYGISGAEILDALKKVIQNELEREQPADINGLCPHWRLTDKPLSPTDALPHWFIYTCVGVVAACLLLYAVLFFSVQAKANGEQEVHAAAYLADPDPRGGTAP